MELSNLGKSKGGYAPVPDSESNKILSTDDKSKSNYNYIKIATITFILSSFLAVLVYYGDKMNHNTTPDVVILQTSYTYGDKMANLDTNLLNSRGFNIDKLSFNNKINSEVQTSILHENIVTSWGHGLGTIKINDKIKYQKILGFGGAFTEAAAYNFDKLPKLKQDEVINLYFGEDSIGYTLGRIHINSCDFSLKSYTFDECDGDYDLMCFDTEVTHDNAIMIPFMIKAGTAVADRSNNEDKLRLLSSPWSPPSWMKKPDKNTGNQSMLGSAEPTCLLDDPKIHLAWANYISKFIEAYKKKGVSIWALTPQNEPEFAAPWEACSYNATAELDFINDYLGPIIRQNHPEVLLLAFDHNKDHLFHWAKTMVDGTKKDKTGKDYVDGMAFHWYAGENDRMLDGTYGYDALNLTHHYAKDKILLATEGCSCPGVNINDWLRAERLSHDIIFDLLNYAQGWIDWNLLVDSNGGPNHLDNMCDAPIVLSSDYSTFHIQPKFYYMGHISKYIVPDSVRIDSSIVGNYNFIDTDPNIRSGVEVGVFNCEKSVRQRWFVNSNSSIELTRYVLDDIEDEQGSYSRLCLGVGSVDRPFIRLVNCNNIDKDNHRIVQVKQTDEGQLVDKVSKKCLALVNGITDPGALIELQTCDSSVSHQRFVIDKVTGEIIPYSTLDGSNHVGLCLTAGWPMLHGVAVQNPSNQIVTVIVNEAMVDTELILFANMKELNFGINDRYQALVRSKTWEVLVEKGMEGTRIRTVSAAGSADGSVDDDLTSKQQTNSATANNLVAGGAAASEYSREDILKQIFGDVGDLIVDLSCAVESTVLLHGRMYITNRHLCFYSNIFGLEKKIRIPYSHITAITKEMTALVIPNALSVTTYRKEYLFRSFWDRDECYRLLKDIVTKYKSGGVAAVVDVGYNNGKRGSVMNTERQRTNTLSSIDSTIQTKPKSSSVDSTTTISNLPNPIIDSPDQEEEEEEFGLHDSKNDFVDEIQKARLKISVISGDLNISLKDFAKLFIEENAIHSYGKYHEEVNDTNVIVSQWTEMSSSLGKGRDIKFLKPVNLPALKSTRGVKVQRYRKFGELGLIVYSSTRLEDVPAADTFSVEDVLIIKSIGEEKINIDITFEVKFIKSTMFKYVIESNTNSEMTKWLEAFYHRLVKCSSMSNHMNEKEKINRISIKPKDVVVTKAPINFLIDFFDSILEKTGISGSTTFWAAWLLLFLTFSFFSYQWLSVNRRISNMHHEIAVTNSLLNSIIETQNYIKKLSITDINGDASIFSASTSSNGCEGKLVTLTTEITKMTEKISALEKILNSK